MSKRDRYLKKCSGLSLIEAAIILPVMLVLIFGIIELGNYYRKKIYFAQSTWDIANAAFRACINPFAVPAQPLPHCDLKELKDSIYQHAVESIDGFKNGGKAILSLYVGGSPIQKLEIFDPSSTMKDKQSTLDLSNPDIQQALNKTFSVSAEVYEEYVPLTPIGYTIGFMSGKNFYEVAIF